jgi:hypothetical protein
MRREEGGRYRREGDGQRGRRETRQTNPIKLFNNQTNPNIHPTVVSPLKLLHSSTKSKVNLLPATSVVNRIKIEPQRYQRS